MTEAEWWRIAAEIQARWPQREIEDETLRLWFADLEAFPAEQVQAAMLAFYVEGREWAPNSGQLVKKIAELDDDEGDFGEAWALVKRANLKDPAEGMPWLEERSPAAAEAVRRLGSGNRHCLMTYQLADEPTVRAQFRDIYKGVQRDRLQGRLYKSLPSGTGLRRLEGLQKPGFRTIADRAAGRKELTSGGQPTERTGG